MGKNKKKELPYEEAAVNVSGKTVTLPEESWQCKGCGKVYQGAGAEGCARYCCHTSRKCKCGTGIVSRSGAQCRNCWLKVRSDRRLKELSEAVEVDESELTDYMVTDGDSNYWDSTDEYLELHFEVEAEDLYTWLFVAEFDPLVVVADGMIENACDGHPEEVYDNLDDGALREAVTAFNALNVEKRIGSYTQVKKKVRVPVEEVEL